MIHKLTIKDKEYLLVEVKKDATDFCFGRDANLNRTLFWNNGGRKYIPQKGKIINTISNLTESECIDKLISLIKNK